MRLSSVDALAPESVENPYELYEYLREESPVHWDAKLEVFLVSRYDDVVSVLRDAETFSSSVEFLSQFAAPLPLTVIAEQLGVPRSRIGDFKRWFDAFMDFIGGLASDERSVECARQIMECQRYFNGRIEEYRSNPQCRTCFA